MTTRPNLNDLASLANETSVINTINGNNDTVETAIERGLSRYGEAPNEMEANLDMNNHRILNLPDALLSHEPITKKQLEELLVPISALELVDHGALLGLTDDDHPQYHNDARGDLRYSQLGHTHAQTDITDLVSDLAAKQPLDSDLTAIAALSTTTYGRALLTVADAAAARSNLGLGTLATQSGTFSGTSSGTNTGDQTITLTGDVTGSGTGSFAATIANQAVSYAKIQNVSATARILGRYSGGAGSAQEISLGTKLTLSGGGVLDVATREQLTAARTYYVRTDGSDSNNGLTNSSGGAFLTVQKAINTIFTLDIGTYNVTIQLGNTGAYNNAITVSGAWLGSGSVTLRGDPAAASSYTITTSGQCILVSNGGSLNISGITLSSSASSCLIAGDRGLIQITNTCRLGTAAGYHIYADGGTVNILADYHITGGAYAHWYTSAGKIVSYDRDHTNDTITFGYTFAWADMTGIIFCPLSSFPNKANVTVALQYAASLNGVINTSGGGAGYLPGAAAGTPTTGGQYA